MSTYLQIFSRAEQKAYERGYRVNELGQVISPRGKVRVLTPNGTGHLRFRIEKRGTTIAAHRLLAFQLWGDAIYQPGICVRHLDGNPQNNTAANLALGTHQDNMMDKPETIRKRDAINASRHMQKYDHAVILEFLAHHSYRKARAKFGCAMGTLSFIKRQSLAAKQSATPC